MLYPMTPTSHFFDGDRVWEARGCVRIDASEALPDSATDDATAVLYDDETMEVHIIK